MLDHLEIFDKILDRNNPITTMLSWEFATCRGLNSSPQCPILSVEPYIRIPILQFRETEAGKTVVLPGVPCSERWG